jgi:hypothetical protein
MVRDVLGQGDAQVLAGDPLAVGAEGGGIDEQASIDDQLAVSKRRCLACASPSAPGKDPRFRRSPHTFQACCSRTRESCRHADARSSVKLVQGFEDHVGTAPPLLAESPGEAPPNRVLQADPQ